MRDQVALARDQRAGAASRRGRRRRPRGWRWAASSSRSTIVVARARQVHGVGQRLGDRPDARGRGRAPAPVAFDCAVVGVGAGAQRRGVALESAGGQLLLARHLPSLVCTAIGGSPTVGVDALEEAVVEAHDLVEPARRGPSSAGRCRRSRCRARGPTGRARRARSRCGCARYCCGAVGDRVVLGQALREEQRHVRARSAPGIRLRSFQKPSRGRRWRPGRRSSAPGTAGCRWGCWRCSSGRRRSGPGVAAIPS